MNLMPWEFRDAVVVVTGASSGIGRTTAKAFAAQGARVVLAARSEPDLRRAALECDAAGGQALAVPTDVTDQEAVHELARQAVDRFGRIDVWLNNAGVLVYGRLEEAPAEAYRRVIETNLFGQIHGARAVLPYFRKQGEGVLINTCSMWGRMSSPYVGAYVTSKFGVLGFSESLRQEVVDAENIHVCTILPMSVDTPIFHHAGNYTGHGTRPVPPVVDPNRVVKAILRCARDPRPEVVVGQTGHLLTLMHTLAPRLYDRLVPHVFRLTALSAEANARTPGNLFEPMPYWNRPTGGWRAKRNAYLRRGAIGAGAVLVPWLACRMLRRRGRR